MAQRTITSAPYLERPVVLSVRDVHGDGERGASRHFRQQRLADFGRILSELSLRSRAFCSMDVVLEGGVGCSHGGRASERMTLSFHRQPQQDPCHC